MADPQITEVVQREAPDIEAIKIALLKDAQQLATTPVNLPAYQVSGLSDLQREAITGAEQGIGAYQPYLATATDLMGQAQIPAAEMFGVASPYISGAVTTGTDLMQQGAMGVTPEMIQAQMNPYQQAVYDEIQRAYDIQRTQARGQAAGAGAFGGSRAGIMETEIGRNMADAIAKASAQNFLQAQAAAQNQRQRQLAAGQGIGSLGISGGGALGQLAAAQSGLLSDIGLRQAGLGEAAQKLGQTQASYLFDLGERQRLLDQMVLDAQRKTAIEQAYEPYQRIGFLSDIYKGAPTTQMSLTGSSVPTASPFQQAVGALTAVGSTAAAANKAGLFG